MFTLPFGVLLSALLLGAGRTILGTVGGRIDRLTADGAALSRPFPHHVSQALKAVQRRSHNAQPLEVVQKVGFDALQTGLGDAEIVGFNGNTDELLNVQV